MHRGYIKLWRKSLDSSVWDNANIWRLWCWCLMKTSHKQYKCMIGLQEIELMAGQFIFGRKKCSMETGLSEQIVRSCLQALKSTNNLTIKSTNKYSIITIINWNSYQSDEAENNQQITSNLTNNQPTNNQQITTYKNDKNNKNVKEYITAKRRYKIPNDFSLDFSMKEFASKNGINGNSVQQIFEAFKDYHIGRGTLMIDWAAAWRTWVRNDKKFNQNKYQQDTNAPYQKILRRENDYKS